MPSHKRRRGSKAGGRHRSHQNPGGFGPDELFFAHDEPGRSPTVAWRPDPKTMQLCRQVQQRLDLCLAADFDDAELGGLWVDDVVPMPGGASLLVRLTIDDAARSPRVLAKLHAIRSRLRTEVAAAICRKRTPHLQFALVPVDAVFERDAEVDDDG